MTSKMQEIAQKINANYWAKNGLERAYINFGLQTDKTKTKCWVELDENDRPRIMVKVENFYQHENWCKSQAQKIKEDLLEIYGDILNEEELNPIDVTPFEYLQAEELEPLSYQLTPKFYQIEAFYKLIGLKSCFLMFDMGTGKTFTSIMFADARKNAKLIDKVIYISKKSTIEQTQKAVQNTSHFHKDYFFFGAESISSSENTQNDIIEILSHYRCMLILDESDMFKNGNTNRLNFLIRHIEKFKYVLLMTGTPATKNIADLYFQFKLIDFGTGDIIGMPSYDKFENRYVIKDAKTLNNPTPKIAGYRNLQHLFSLLQPYIYQINKEEAYEIAVKKWNYKTAYLSYLQKSKIRELEGQISEWNRFSVLNYIEKSQQIASGFLIENSQIEAEYESEKYSKVLEILQENIKNDKLVIFCKYRKEVEYLVEVLSENQYHTLRYYGDDKFNPKEEFEKSENQILITTYSKGNAGLDLHFCNNMIFFSPTFDLKLFLQAQDRIHRIGQKKDCNYWIITTDCPTDIIFNKCIVRKTDLVNNVINNLITNKSFENV